MSEADLYDLFRISLWTVVHASTPIVIAGAAVGLVISLIQSMTQIQEATISFVPKVFAMLAALYFGGSYFAHVISGFGRRVFDMIVI